MSDWGELEQEGAVGAARSCRQARAEEEGSQAAKAPGPMRSVEEADPERSPELELLRHWVMTHREEVARYRGKRVAIHPEKGIIASADSYSQLDELLKKMGVADTEVFIDFISLGFSSK